VTEDSRRQVFHENSEQANTALKNHFISFGTKLDEWTSDSKVLTEAYMLLKKTDPKNDTVERELLVSSLDNGHLRAMVADMMLESILCEVQQGRAKLAEMAQKNEKPERAALLDGCCAAQVGRNALGLAHKVIAEFERQTGIEDAALAEIHGALEKLSSVLVKVLPVACARHHNCEKPSACPLAKKLA